MHTLDSLIKFKKTFLDSMSKVQVILEMVMWDAFECHLRYLQLSLYMTIRIEGPINSFLS